MRHTGEDKTQKLYWKRSNKAFLKSGGKKKRKKAFFECTLCSPLQSYLPFSPPTHAQAPSTALLAWRRRRCWCCDVAAADGFLFLGVLVFFFFFLFLIFERLILNSAAIVVCLLHFTSLQFCTASMLRSVQFNLAQSSVQVGLVYSFVVFRFGFWFWGESAGRKFP